jgi:hypothetical protein
MPLLETKGAASAQGFGLTSAVAAAKYIEDYFQTWLRTGTGASATVTTGLNASINKSLVWTKSRSAATDHKFTDTVRGATKALVSNSTAAETTDSQGLTAFSSTGYTIGTNTTYNNSGATYVDWQFVATPKFFDVVTYTGNGVGAGQNINHNLGSVPGCIIAKRTNSTGDWYVLHRSVGSSGGSNAYLLLNSTAAAVNPGLAWGGFAPTSTQFAVEDNLNINGATYVAYLFAHDAGGFGASGTGNVISCGSFTTDGSGNATVTLGYEPQWVLTKRADGARSWELSDVMRGMPVTTTSAQALRPDLSDAESSAGGTSPIPSATGFSISGAAQTNSQFIYIAIRRGPMRTPTTGTSVYNALTRTGTGAAVNITGVGFPPDLVANKGRNTAGTDNLWTDRLRGATKYAVTNSTNAEATNAQMVTALGQDGVSWGNDDGNFNTYTYVNWFFRRAPGFFDVVCYTADSVNGRALSHNLAVTPEMTIFKSRGATSQWYIWHSALGATTQEIYFTNGAVSLGGLFTQAPTAATLYLSSGNVNFSSFGNCISYLFATVAGVSKVGSYTGTGTTLQVNCGFTGGSRFVMIKRTDSTGDWYVWDSARGIVAGNDPYLLLNSSAAEVTGTDYIDTFSSGFEISSTAPAAINANGGTFIFLAIA